MKHQFGNYCPGCFKQWGEPRKGGYLEVRRCPGACAENEKRALHKLYGASTVKLKNGHSIGGEAAK